jgi:hypothetical protein
LHLYEPTPSFLHNATTIPLNDKRQIDVSFWHLSINMAFFVHTLNPNNKIFYTFMGYNLTLKGEIINVGATSPWPTTMM